MPASAPRGFRQVDVFGKEPLLGNPLAVVLAADDLDSSTMQRVATWTNLSETAFLLEPTVPDADYRVRIFTSTQELPFAGHPTLGSARAWLNAGGAARSNDVLVQECGAGLVTLRRDDHDDLLAFAAPPLSRFEPVEQALTQRLAAALGLHPEEVLGASWLVNGPPWVGIRLSSARRVLDVRVEPEALDGHYVGVVGPHPAGSGSDADVEVRAFVPGDAVFEDPATGSLNAGLAHWLITEGHCPTRYVAAQGTAIGRAARLHVRHDGESLWVGGRADVVVSGTMLV